MFRERNLKLELVSCFNCDFATQNLPCGRPCGSSNSSSTFSPKLAGVTPCHRISVIGKSGFALLKLVLMASAPLCRNGELPPQMTSARCGLSKPTAGI
jgi:hypothetical protein